MNLRLEYLWRCLVLRRRTCNEVMRDGFSCTRPLKHPDLCWHPGSLRRNTDPPRAIRDMVAKAWRREPFMLIASCLTPTISIIGFFRYAWVHEWFRCAMYAVQFPFWVYMLSSRIRGPEWQCPHGPMPDRKQTRESMERVLAEIRDLEQELEEKYGELAKLGGEIGDKPAPPAVPASLPVNGTVAERAEHFLSTCPKKTARFTEIKSATGASDSGLITALNQLIGADRAKRTGRGVYKLL